MIILVDDKVTFQLKRATAHGYRFHQLSVDSFYHPFGFFVPEARSGGEVLDILAGDLFDGRSLADTFAGLLVTPKGKCYWMARQDENYARRRTLYGPGTIEVLEGNADISQCMGMALSLTNNNVDEALKIFNQAINGQTEGYVTLSIPDIVEELKKRGYTDEPKALQPWRSSSGEPREVAAPARPR